MSSPLDEYRERALKGLRDEIKKREQELRKLRLLSKHAHVLWQKEEWSPEEEGRAYRIKNEIYDLFKLHLPW